MPDTKAVCVGLIGPMKAAWDQTFKEALDKLAPVLVIVWHDAWMRPQYRQLWGDLYNRLLEIKGATRILMIVFGDTPNDLAEEQYGDPATVLLRALAADRQPQAGDPKPPVGWASITEVNRFETAAVQWHRPEETNKSALLRLCSVCAELSTWTDRPSNNLPSLTLTQFFHFLADPVTFRARILHGVTDSSLERRRLNTLKWLAARVQVPRSLPLNVLFVENDSQEPIKSAQKVFDRLKFVGTDSACPLRYLQHSNCFVLSEGFHLLKSDQGRKDIRATKFTDGWSQRTQGPTAEIPWLELDLVLQDVMLGDDSGDITGLSLVSFYFDACPQALVFLLTGLDIESLVASGDVNWKFVDAVIAKDGFESLWFEYRRCFHERFGRMFWPGWARVGCPQSSGTDVEDNERQLLRHMFRSLRKWQIEPDILWHGQTLPEMIDHANRHISALWRLVNDFVGTLIENGGADNSLLDLRHRVALALAVWMHDVGHRGDQYVIDSINIRKIHAGISERLLLRNPGAYGLDWLLAKDRTPYPGCRPNMEGKDTGRSDRLECRNQTECREGSQPLCLLREAGLLCRHHQSNAPLDEHSVAYIKKEEKDLSPYSFVPDPPNNGGADAETFLADMLGRGIPKNLPMGARLRRLEEFKVRDPIGFRRVAGLLRMLDALQLHRSRVGSAASIESFVEFLDNRNLWCSAEINRRAAGGAEVSHLNEYKKILNSQDWHYWRQAVSHSTQVLWRWKENGEATIDISFALDERALKILRAIEARLDRTLGPAHRDLGNSTISNHTNGQEISKWIEDVGTNVVGSEHGSQYFGPREQEVGYLGVLIPHVVFRVVVARTDQTSLIPHVLHSASAGHGFRASCS